MSSVPKESKILAGTFVFLLIAGLFGTAQQANGVELPTCPQGQEAVSTALNDVHMYVCGDSDPYEVVTHTPITLSHPIETIDPPLSEMTKICQEDEPCWDCATMGNLICGPGAVRPNQPNTDIQLPEILSENISNRVLTTIAFPERVIPVAKTENKNGSVSWFNVAV
jgi:hypothetical protein